jgi:hypothetical protein
LPYSIASHWVPRIDKGNMIKPDPERAIVQRGDNRGKPWGVSSSAGGDFSIGLSV